MESSGAFPDGEWESICKMFFTEGPEFSSPFLDHCPIIPTALDNSRNLETPSAYVHHDQDGSPASICNGAAYCPPDALIDHNPIHFSRDQSSPENYYLDVSNQLLLPNDQISSSMDFFLMEGMNDCSLTPLFLQGLMMDEGITMKGASSSHRMDYPEDAQLVNVGSTAGGGQVQLIKRKSDSPEELDGETDEKTSLSPAPKKRARVVKHNEQKGKRKMPSKKKTKNEEEETNNNGGSNGQSSSSDISDNESNASQEANEGVNSEAKEAPALDSNGKKRASRGAATDPQSLYARRRREKINERLRILQNLVPNGTKVDISTMLEEAVHYVKFLQLQIKLLSSDELWMYAPLAYNGVDIGLCKLSPFLLGP